MEVISRINAFLGIMFIVLVIDHLSVSSFNGGNLIGQAYEVKGVGEIKEELNLEITEEMKTLIDEANELYLDGDVFGATEKFDELMLLRVKAGGTLPINKFTGLLPEYNDLVFKSDRTAKAGFSILNKEGRIIAKEIKEINKIMTNQNEFFNTIFYIFLPEKSFAVLPPNKKKFNVNNKFYYPYVNAEGELGIKRFMLYWFDLKVENDLKKAVMTKMVNSKIKEGNFNVLLNEKNHYNFKMEGKQSLVGRAITWMEEIAIYPN